MKYQIYAFDANGKLNHAGTRNFRGSVTAKKCNRYEQAWQKWRRRYLFENPGNYPLRDHSDPSVVYFIHPSGKPEKTTRILLRKEV